MFIIDLRNTNVSEYRSSVIGNNNVDVAHIYSRFIEYATGYNAYLKVLSSEEDYCDKIEIDSADMSIDDGALLIKWTMGEVSTRYKKIFIQLQFENNDGSIIAQSRIVSIVLSDSIQSDVIIPPLYPKVLQQLRQDVDALAENKLDKVTNQSGIYAVNSSHEQVMLTYTVTPSSSAIVQRRGEQIMVPQTPATNDDATSKKYVDDEVAKKVNKTNTASQLYGTDGSGNQTTFTWTTSVIENAFPRRDNAGRLFVRETPDMEGEAVSMKYADKKLPKLNVPNAVYVNDSQAQPSYLYYGKSATGEYVVQRDSGQINVPETPTANAHATSKKYVDDLVTKIKRDSYLKVDITEYPTLADFLESEGEEGYLYLYPIDTSEAPDFQSGYYRYIWENNAWVDLGTTQIDLSNYVDKTTTQTISGDKTFSGTTTFSGYVKSLKPTGVRPALGDSSHLWTTLCVDGEQGNIFLYSHDGTKHASFGYSYSNSEHYLGIDFNGTSNYAITSTRFYPAVTNTKDLGDSTHCWKDLYLAGNITNGTKTVAVANIVDTNDLLASAQDIADIMSA